MAPGGQDHVGAVTGEGVGGRKPYAARGAGDHHRSVAQTFHDEPHLFRRASNQRASLIWRPSNNHDRPTSATCGSWHLVSAACALLVPNGGYLHAGSQSREGDMEIGRAHV